MDERAKTAQAWAFDGLGDTQWRIETIGSDASARRYFRLSQDEQSFILMDAPPLTEPVNDFLDIQARLSNLSVHVPKVIASDCRQGFVLLSDLGRISYLDALTERTAERLFDDAQSSLLIIQKQANTKGLGHYKPSKLREELDLFIHWFLAHHWQITPTEDEQARWGRLCDQLIEWAVDQPQVFCHRDYMPRNLMVSEPNPGILDFQDAVFGPISYDPISLYMDAFISWPRDFVDAQLETYRQRAVMAGLPVPKDPQSWLRMCDLMSTQRHLKVIGIFARIAYRDHKPRYLGDVDRFFAYIKQTRARRSELSVLSELLSVWEARRVVTR